MIIEDEGKRYGLLIEDKIDAQAMPNQQRRYTVRGDKAVKKGEFEAYRDFIVCSKSYYAANEEAKKYSHFVSYEECAECLKKSNNPLAEAWINQIKQAITKSKKHSEINIDEKAKEFFNKYKNYQEEYYPYLNLRTKRSSNGWWPEYATRKKGLRIIHKIPWGFIDLTFSGAADKIDSLSNVARSLNDVLATELREAGLNEIIAVPTNESGVLRINVSKVDASNTKFEDVDKTEIEKWFKGLSILSKFANMLASVDEAMQRVRD